MKMRPVLVATALFAVVAATFVNGQDKPINPSNPGGRAHFRAKQILGSKVHLQGNAEVGIVDDIVLDDYGNVDYLIVINSEKQLVTVPWDAAQFNLEKHIAVINIAPDKFSSVPTYSVQQYPVFSTPAYRTQTYKYYGLTPAQERRVIRRGAVLLP